MKKLLTQQQWNQVFAIIQAAGRNVSEFQCLEVPSKFGRRYLVSQLFHLPTQYYFLFDIDEEGQYYSKCCSGPERTIESTFAGSWERELEILGEWLGRN